MAEDESGSISTFHGLRSVRLLELPSEAIKKKSGDILQTPLPLFFFLPESIEAKKKDELTKKILENGGLVVPNVEFFTVQIVPEDFDKLDEFFEGIIVGEEWLKKSISSNRLMPFSEYRL